jgi:predicted O-methyltransferase YrrM
MSKRNGLLRQVLKKASRVVFGSRGRLESVDDPTSILGLQDVQVKLDALHFTWGDLYTHNSLVLLCWLAASGYCPVFEFGTFRGRTTYNIALNLPSDSKIVTVDAHYTDDADANVEGMHYPPYTTGEVFQSRDEAIRSKITVLSGDSTTMDFSRYYGQFGLVFVDGGHSYDACRRDSLTAVELLRPGGVVVWDDYGDYWPGVRRAVDELSKQYRVLNLPRNGVTLMVKPA